MNDDAALLHCYAEEGSEAAFAELVRRHLDLVYGAALRRTGDDTHRAADVAQQVFITLARQARKLSRHTVLSAWLHTATRNAALNLMISEQRRKAREREALDAVPAGNEPTPDWERIRPALDAAIDELPEADRAAVVLRFLERRPFGEIGEALKVSSDAARMRTERALDKLRATLARRGITSTAAVGALISSQPLISAPAGLAATISAGSFTMAGAGAGGLTLTLASLTNLNTVVVGMAVLFAFGAGTYVGLIQQFDTPPPPAPETPRHSQMIADLRKENLSLRVEVEQRRADNARLTAASDAVAPARPASMAQPASTPSPQSVAEKQKAMLNNLRQLAAAADQFNLENERWPNSIHELVGEDKYVRKLVPVDGEDYSNIVFNGTGQMVLNSPNGISISYDPGTDGANGTRESRPPTPPMPPHLVAIENRLSGSVQQAIHAYQAAHKGQLPPDSEAGGKALLPYFTNPQEGADFVEYMEELKQAGRLPR